MGYGAAAGVTSIKIASKVAPSWIFSKKQNRIFKIAWKCATEFHNFYVLVLVSCFFFQMNKKKLAFPFKNRKLTSYLVTVIDL